MNKVYQINILEADDGFIIQAGGKQFVAIDEATLQEKVKQAVTMLLKAPEQPTSKTQTIKRFGDPIQTVKPK